MKTLFAQSVRPQQKTSTRLGEILAGARAEIPLIVGAVPFGLIYGVTAIAAHVGAPLALAMSSIIFAGSSQFIVAQLIGAGASAVVIVITAAIVNLRHALYSASLAPYLRDLRPGWKRWLLAYLLTDEAYAVSVLRYRDGDASPYRNWYFLGAGLSLWTSWQISTAAGIFLGASIPANWSLDFAGPLTFIALVAPRLRDRANTTVAIIAGVSALVVAGLPLKLGLIVAITLGVGAGMLWPARPPLPPNRAAMDEPQAAPEAPEAMESEAHI